jgi:uncharacterized membrane protein
MSTQPPGPRTVHSWSLERLVFFSDAVFAIAITLLVLPLTEVQFTDVNLGRELLRLWPELLSFVMSFAVIGNYWVAHHRMFRHIVDVDARLVWLNFGFLLVIAFLPFPTAVLGEHGDTTPAAVLYAGAMSLTGFTSATMWAHASYRGRLVHPALDRRAVRYLQLRSLVVPATFVPSIGVAFLSPVAAWFLWLAAFPLLGLVRRLGGR